MNKTEESTLALLNLTKAAADNHFDHWSIVNAVNVLRRAGVSEDMIPSIEYLIPDDVRAIRDERSYTR